MNPKAAIKSLQHVPGADVLRFMTELQRAVADNRQFVLDRMRIESARDICLKELEERYATYRLIFDHLFAERKEAIAGYFRLIDESRSTGDRELLLKAMHGLSEIVTSSPFRDLDKLRNVLAGDGVIEV